MENQLEYVFAELSREKQEIRVKQTENESEKQSYVVVFSFECHQELKTTAEKRYVCLPTSKFLNCDNFL